MGIKKSYHVQDCVSSEPELEILEDDPDKPLDLGRVESPEEIHEDSFDALAAVVGLGRDDVVQPGKKKKRI